MTKKHKHIRVGGTFFGVSTRVDGKTRANFITSPATGQDRPAVKAVRKALGQDVECPVCGGPGTLGRRTPNGMCRDAWHDTCGRRK